MWPGLREGDLIVYTPLEKADLRRLVGQIAVATSPSGPVVHRIRRVFGARGRERVVLSGDLLASDPPRSRPEILGVAKALYRPGRGFVELPRPLDVGPAGRVVLHRLGRFFTWAKRQVSAGDSAPSRG